LSVRVRPRLPPHPTTEQWEERPIVNRIRGLFSRFRRFVDEAWSELKKVSWPTLQQTRSLTLLVFAVSFAVGVFITVFDAIFLNAVKFITPA
jgi:preprotein translocase SecE subunit